MSDVKIAANEDKPYTGALLVISAVTVITAIVTFVGVDALAGWAQEVEFAEKVESRPFYDLDQLRTQQNERLSSYGWVDQDAGTVHVPIDTAKQMVLDEQR
jgi:hypothetical protein